MSNDPNTVSNQAPYYEGLGFPIDRLSSDDFENFVFGCLLSIQDILGLRVIGKPSGSGDGGFDVQGVVVATGRLVCVQCKRQGQPLDMGQLIKELAKVAATSALEGSSIGEHRFICTGGVRKKVVSALRATSRQEIATEVGNALQSATDGELVSLRVKLEQRGETPRKIAESYVLKLDRLTAWNLKEFDAALSPRWEAILEVAQRYFRIATVVRDNPRAAFDRLAYIAEYRHFHTIIEPRFVSTDLPTGISIGTDVNINAGQKTALKNFSNIDDFLQLDVGDLALLVGQGGVGKSTSLALIRARALQTSPECVLPILISLATYVPGALDRLINQELSADYGTWRLLPDKVLLLCDGLNECTHANMTAFFGELSPLLRRRRIACVLSSREPNRLNNIILPQFPLGCVEVQSITPVAMRRIAEGELDQQAADVFTKNYVLLAENSGSLLLWTPFAVKVALRVWKLKSAIPSTLGEMIEALLKSRSIRNSSFPQSKVHSTVLLQLASALAFQCVFISRRLEFPISEAGKWIRESKTHCSDALGIGDLKDTEIVDLLVSQELLRISERGYIGFGHQLLAGSLSAAMLAQTWRNHLDSLRESVADDAWVFAARLVSREHMENFLRVVLDADLILGARVARELPSDLQDIAEEMLSRSIAPEVSMIFRLQGLYALARLGTPKAMRRLREATSEADSQMRYSAFRALASAGDAIYLRGLLPEIDKLKSTPIKISGGDVAIWEAAPLSMRISLARERLSRCGAGEPVGESLFLLAYEKDPSDVPAIERHLRAASDLTAFQIGLYALHAVDPSQAKKFFDEVLLEYVEPHDKARLIRAAAGVGIDIDTRMAFECAIAETMPSEPDNHSEYYLQQLISDVLKNAELPHDMVSIVERDLPRATGPRKARLWQVAHRCDSSAISLYAFSCIDKWTSDRGNACNYFIEMVHSVLTPKQELLSLCEKGLSEEANAYDWTTSRVFALVGILGFTAKAATSLSIMIERLARIRHAVDGNDYSCLSPSDLQALNSIKSEHMLIRLGGLAAELIPAAAKARHLLSHNDLLLLLPFQTNGYEGLVELQREMLSDVEDIYVDDVLTGITDRWTRLSVLLIVSNRKPTDSRIKLLERELQASYAHPAALHIVCQAVENCWCEDVLDMVLNTVASIPIWREQDTQFFWDFFQMVAKFLRAENLPAIEFAILSARTQFAEKIMNIWREYASGEKIGLARL
ncbi:restriction endonuclease [Pseudomonas sp. 2822-17]|uniref:restriction endonuclease n=1 Tax=Pseudomonas sp. 2822-17 TaxID=1712678 RepID=UPI00117BB1CF|nr:restriction endonuclease [Pseudomonas sp. 2822-17]